MAPKASPCKYCDNPVAYNAKRCPKCGGKYPYPDILTRFAENRRNKVATKSIRITDSKLFGCLGIFILFIVIIVLIPAGNNSQPTNKKTQQHRRSPTSTTGTPNTLDAWYEACNRVKSELYSPVSAKFPGPSDPEVHIELIETVSDPKGGTQKFYRFSVHGFVDAENGLGTIVRKRFYATLWTDGNKWILEDKLDIR